MKREIEKYDVFQLAHSALLEIYALTRTFPADEKFGLTAQMRRAAYSITMNLIEGSARATTKDFRHYVGIAYASSAEVKYQIRLCRDLDYISHEQCERFHDIYDRLQQMLFNLHKSLTG